MSYQHIIDSTALWVKNVIVKYNICPFARPELDNNSIRYIVLDQTRIDPLLDAIEAECRYLDTHPKVATTLVMLAKGFDDFNDYLDLLDLTQQSVIDPQYEGTYQLASFHPDYCFADSNEDDPSNYTNRAPYPTIHLIREASITVALEEYDEPESIPERNIAFARRKGAKKMAQLLAQCMTAPKEEE